MEPARPPLICPLCQRPIDPRRLDDVRRVIVDARRTEPAHFDCARARPLCPVHRQCYAGTTCPRCAAEPPPSPY